jgi:hypothetical protein
MLNDRNVKVCRKEFLSLYAMTDRRVKRLRSLLVAGRSPYDNRGKNLSADAITGEDVLKIREHVESLPVKQSHCVSGTVYYLNAELSVTTVY